MERTHFVVQKDVFLTLKYGNTRWRPGLRPGPRWGSLRRSPDPSVGWGGDTPPRPHSAQRPRRLEFRAFGAQFLAFPLLLIYEMTTAFFLESGWRRPRRAAPHSPVIVEQFLYSVVCRWNCWQNVAVTRLVPAVRCVIRRRASVNVELT